MSSQLTSQSLLERLNDRGDQGAWELFIDIYRPLLRHCLAQSGIPPRERDDLLQDCFAKLLVALPEFSHNGRQGAFRNWLRTVSRRHAIEFLRRQKLGRDALARVSIRNFDDTFNEHFDKEHDHFVVNRILELIRPEFTLTTWKIFEQLVFGNRPAAQVANTFGRTTNAVLLCKSRVLRRMREMGRGIIEC